uniref:COPI coat complex subunit gamma 1 n=1 Tax=Molossus molossus TaxID=27622 RepID=A0A7J8HF71_MOLMO|nr:COPI coat complex subunit gamma 1 [Molossus molossus]
MLKKFDKKDEESGGGSNPFQHLEKSAVLQEARVFNETPINPRKCAHILTKILYLINQGEHLGTTEATEAFFAMTKLFQSNDPTLRRMCYLTIKEMSCIAEDVIIVTSSLTKDMTGKEDNYRGPAVRALCQITDSTMLQAIERYMKQAIVDKVPSVSSSALVSSLHLLKCSFDVVKRWVNEAQEAASSDNIMVQYHALGLLYHVRRNDRLAVNKMISKFTRHGLKSPFAYCMMIRVASKQLEEEDSSHDSPLFDFIESCLRNNPSKYIRFIYNRVVLEHEEVRAGAVSALAKFGAQNEEMLPSILVLLKRCVMDDDNEVRDRATFYLNVLEQKQKALNAGYILNGLTVSIPGLERALQQYTLEPSEKPFDLKSVPLATTPMAEQRTESTPITAAKQPEKVAATRQEIFQEQLAAVPEFNGLGPLFKSSPEPVALTESETEYVIHCTKHTFTDHMVFQFDCTNTLNDQTLENVTVQMEPTESYEVLCYVPAWSLPYNQPGTCYTLVALPKEDPTAVACTFSCMMKFTVKDCDPTTGETDDEGYEDEYVLEDLEVTIADHIQKVMKLNFEAAWDEVGDEFEKEETFTLSTTKTLEEAVGNIVKFLGMHPCERSDKVPDNKNTHTLLLAGVFRGGHDILVRSRLLLLDTVTMQVTARSSEELPVDIILASVG